MNIRSLDHISFIFRWRESVITALLMLQPIQLYSAPTNIDSYINQLEQEDPTKLTTTANQFFDVLYKEGITDFLQRFSSQSHPDTIRAISWYWAAEYMYAKQHYDQCSNLAERALPLLHKYKMKAMESNALTLSGLAWFRRSNYYNAITYLKKSLDIDRQLKDKSRINSSLSNLAGILLAAKQFDMAEKCILNSIAICKTLHDPAKLAIRYGMASEIYHSMKKDELALDYANKAFELDSAGQRLQKLAIRRSQRAAAYFNMGRLKEAKKELDKAIPVLKQSNNVTSLGICCNQMGEILLAYNHLNKATRYFQQALDIFIKKEDIYNQCRSRKGLYNALKGTNPQKASEHILAYSELKDSLYNTDIENIVGYNLAELNREELEIRATSLWHSSIMTIIFAVTIIIIMMGIIAVLLFAARLKSKSYAALHDLSIARDQFFTHITHEFRTPLTVIQAACNHILEAGPNEIDEIHVDTINIRRQGNNLLQLINRILALAKLKSDRSFSPQWYQDNLVRLIEITIDSFRNLTNQKQIKISYTSKPANIKIDFVPEYLQNILRNLLSNAIKFSPEGAEVKIRIWKEASLIKIAVRDSGNGMTEAEMVHIFEPFYQTKETTKNNIGSGIGLPLVKLSAEAMDGQVSVQSTPGIGSVFLVTLPQKHGHTIWPLYAEYEDKLADETSISAQEMQLDDSAADDEDAIRILIAEDTPEVAHYMAHQLKGNYNFYFAPNGRVALEKANQLVPDVIITDIMMPELDGIEFCKMIRQSDLLNHIPVIIVTAKATHEDLMTGLEAGADAYLEKPFCSDELNIRVAKLLEQRELLKEKYSQEITYRQDIAITIGNEENQSNEFITKFIQKVHEQMPTGKIDYTLLASEMFVTRAQLNRKIKAVSGMSTSAYIHIIRIAAAKEMLLKKDMPVNEVAMKCGMNDVSYFCSSFKKATGLTPKQFRSEGKIQ